MLSINIDLFPVIYDYYDVGCEKICLTLKLGVLKAGQVIIS